MKGPVTVLCPSAASGQLCIRVIVRINELISEVIRTGRGSYYQGTARNVVQTMGSRTGDTGNVWRHFWLSKLEVCYWHPWWKPGTLLTPQYTGHPCNAE